VRADDILNQIDDTLHDWTVSDDAMRSRPAHEAAKPQLWIAPVGTTPASDDWQEVGHIRDIDVHIEPPAIDPEFAQTWQAFREQLARAEAARVRQAMEALQAIKQAFQQLITPAAREAARAVNAAAQAVEQARQAGICDDHGRPLPPRDRPAWQSRYGPAHQRRKRH
jgi:hypothetical protein